MLLVSCQRQAQETGVLDAVYLLGNDYMACRKTPWSHRKYLSINNLHEMGLLMEKFKEQDDDSHR